MSRPEPDMPPNGPAALREILRMAEEDRRRGIQYWCDPELADALRDLVREASVPSAVTHGPALRPAATPPGPAGPSSTERPAAKERPATAERPEMPERPAATERPNAIWIRSAPSGSARAADGGRSAGSSGDATSRGFGATGARAARPEWGPPPAAAGRAPDWETQLRAVEAEAAACMACGLCRTRRHVVFGTGDARVPLVFVGEAPGADEDAQGIPFVGRAGQLLTRIIEAMGLSREDVYICNVLKCRPPENRNPAPDEIAKCSPFLERQLDLLRPKVICTLGLFASQTLLQSTAPIGKLRGRVFEHRGIKVLPTYHPAALLRNPNLKAVVWEDVQLLRKILDE
jgi:DNA polymerase